MVRVYSSFIRVKYLISHIVACIGESAGQILDDIFVFHLLGSNVSTFYIHTSENSCFGEKSALSQFALILFKLHDVWKVDSQENH